MTWTIKDSTSSAFDDAEFDELMTHVKPVGIRVARAVCYGLGAIILASLAGLSWWFAAAASLLSIPNRSRWVAEAIMALIAAKALGLDALLTGG